MRRDQEQIKSELLRRRDEFFKRRKLRRKRIRIAAVPSVCCLLLICALAVPQLQLKTGNDGYGGSKTDAAIPIPSDNAAILSIDIAGQPYGSRRYTNTQKITQLMACLKTYPCREPDTVENESAPVPQEAYATVTFADGKQYIYLISEGNDGNPAGGAAQELKKLLNSLPPDA